METIKGQLGTSREARTKPISVDYFQPLGSVRTVERTPGGLELDLGAELFRVDVLSEGLFRLKTSQARRFDDQPTHSVIGGDFGKTEFEVSVAESSIVVSTSAMELVIQRSPFSLSAHRTDGSMIFEDAFGPDGHPIGYLHLNDTFVVTRRLGQHDSIYGLGEKTGSFDRRGRSFILWNTDILHDDVLEDNRLYETDTTQDGGSPDFDPYYSSTPFFYHLRSDTSDMAGFFIDNAYKARFEFGHRNFYRYEFQGGQYTEYVFAGPDMPGILRDFTELTGRMKMPPLWSLGTHQCRFHDYDQDDILRLAAEYRNRRIPCDVLWIDIDYMDGYRVFTWDPRKYDDVGGMLAKLGESQFRAVAIIDPGVKFDPGYSVFDEGVAKNYFCKTESGKLYVGQVWPGRTVFPDFSREEVRAWWGELNAHHASVGLAGIWNDMNEPATGDVPPFAMRFDFDGANHCHERFHNQYALLMAMGTYAGLSKREPNSRPFVLTRAGCAGIQRYAAQWTGDNTSNWEHLALSIAMSCGMGISGQAFVGSDVPGFEGVPSAELAARWSEYGALTPFFRYHNTCGRPDQYPWSFGPAVEQRIRQAVELRYQLLPYLYTSFVQAATTGAPVQRPLVFEFQEDRQARETEDQFLLGDSLLVAPVVGRGLHARHVYLPKGTWVDFSSGETHEGPTYITASAPLGKTPLFARGGAVIPTLVEAPQSTMEVGLETMVLRVYLPARDGDFVTALREDDGITTAYQKGAYVETTFSLSRSNGQVRLTAAVKGNGFDEGRRKRFRLVPYGANVRNVRIDGRQVRGVDGWFEFANEGEDFVAELTLG